MLPYSVVLTQQSFESCDLCTNRGILCRFDVIVLNSVCDCASDELSVQLNDTKTKFIVATPECVTKAGKAASKIPTIQVAFLW